MDRDWEKRLCKITEAEFGWMDRGWFGLQLTFGGNGWGVGDGFKYCRNISPKCQWDSEQERLRAVAEVVEHAAGILQDARVETVSQLIGKPVEVTMSGPFFKDFRILTEVL